MNDPHTPEGTASSATADEIHSALFAQLVMQQSSMATMLLGKTAHPETGQVIRDLEAARLFIDQLEMLESKTKGNLTHEEAALLKQSLMSLRLAFVECVDSSPPPPQTAPPPASSPAEPAPAAKPAAPAASAGEDGPQKKFSKKY